MKHPYVKLAGAVILLCALLFGYYQAIVSRINSGHEASVKRSIEDRLDSIIEAMKSLDAERANRIYALSDRMQASAKLEAAMLRLSADYGKHAVRDHGMVVRLSGGGIVYPTGSTVRFVGYDDLFKDHSEVKFNYIKDIDDDTPRVAFICACPVKGDEYYVSWVDEGDELSLVSPNNEKLSELMTSIEVSHGGHFLDIIDLNQQLLFDYKSQLFKSYETPEAMGITREVLEARPAELEIDGKLYHSAFKTIQEGGETGVFLMLQSNPLFQTGSEAVIIAALAGIILVSVMAWLLATQRFVMDKILTKPMQHHYRPSKMRWMTLVLGGIGVVAVAITGCAVQSIGNFFELSVDGYVSLTMIGQRLGQDAAIRASNAQAEEQWQLECARHLAEVIVAEPDLADGGPLAEFSDAIGTRYIMLFDGDGNECACSTRYTGFSLGVNESDSTTDFRRLLLGVPELVHAPAVDERTGINTRMIGVSYPLPDGRYGAMILAFEPNETDEATEINEMFSSQTAPGRITLAFDEADKAVRFSSDPEYIGVPIEAFNISEARFGNQFMDTLYMMERRCYGVSAKRDGLVYYSVSTARSLSRDMVLFGIQAGAGFAIIYLIMSLYLLSGYTTKWYGYYSVIGSEFDSRALETVLPNGKVKRSIDPSRRWAFSFTSWHNMLPEQVGKSVFSLCVGLCIALGIGDFLFRRYNANTLIAFVISGDWPRGFNLFAIVAILMLSLVIIFGLMLILLALKLTSMALDTKGETICRLAFNLLEYIAVLVLLFYGFEFLGIDVRALLAPLALVSLALSLGSRQLVEDILAGITIVFEGEYQVGDVIDVGGYRGKVVEVGVRTTKLLGKGDNIKIISNRDVRNVLNMSRMNSWIDMEFTLANTVPLQKIEEIMDRELPEIGRSIPDIISGPIYKGIVSMNGSRVTIAVTCECNEEVSFRVQRELYARFHEVFERESLPLV